MERTRLFFVFGVLFKSGFVDFVLGVDRLETSL
jgi:hypothetical protein